MADVWQVYLAETYTKSQTINNNVSKSDKNFFPLHFFFCDNNMFLPLLALQYHQVEIRISWGPHIQNVNNVAVYGNYIFLDTNERKTFVTNTLDFLITQVQTIEGNKDSIDLSFLKHPVKTIFFGYPQLGTGDYWTFTSASLSLNGNYLLENMSPSYFHTVQGYYHTKYGIMNLDSTTGSPVYTQYYMYNFCLDATSYTPTGSCNFSRLDNGKIQILDGNLSETITLYAVNYNVLRIKAGLGGILFSN